MVYFRGSDFEQHSDLTNTIFPENLLVIYMDLNSGYKLGGSVHIDFA